MITIVDNDNLGRLTQADQLPTLKVEWADMLKPATKVVTLSYTLTELKEEVEKRTSYLGKFRRTEEAAHLLDLIAMTKDESDLFSSLVQSVSVEVYGCFQKYAGNDNSKFVYDEAQDNISFLFMLPDSINTAYAQPLWISTKDALVLGVIYQWLLMSYPSDADTYVALYKNALTKVRENSNVRVKNTSMIIPRSF